MEARFPIKYFGKRRRQSDPHLQSRSRGLLIYVIDVAAGEKIPRKNKYGITQSDVFVINKVDLAPNVGASLEVMARIRARCGAPSRFFFTNCMTNDGIDAVVDLIKREVLFEEVAPKALQ